ncbi:MAG: glycosyltransferase family 39 protein [Planctomycetales bacterium]|nr:glycosyltransferase family 39 protein [Planctomycetales bacterium]
MKTVKVKRVFWLIVTIHVALLMYGASVHSPTLNEPAHLVAGLSNWKFGRFELYRVNPPLIRMIAALPVMIVGYEEDWSGFYEEPGARPVVEMGEDFVCTNGERTFWLITYSRWVCIPFSVLGAAVSFKWASELAGSRAGLLAAVFWCFSPNILAYSQLITPDAHAASLCLLSCFVFSKWLTRPTWRLALTSGLILGCVELAKTTFIILGPLWFAIWLGYRFARTAPKTAMLRELAMLATQLFLALYVLNAGYGFQGSFAPLGKYTFVSELFSGGVTPTGNRFAMTMLRELPVPLPTEYVKGIDIQQRDFETFGQPSYLNGEFRDHGWWYYYLVVLLLKLPIGTLLLLTNSVYSLLSPRSRHVRHGLAVLCLLPVAIFGVVSSKSGFSHHGRYALPCLPFVFIVISVVLGRAPRNRFHRTCVVAMLVSSCFICPHYLSFFNAGCGGPRRGSNYLLHSNIDWGQDLIFFRRWLKKHGRAKAGLGYYGAFDPTQVGINEIEPIDVGNDWNAISVNVARGHTRAIGTRRNRQMLDDEIYRHFFGRPPDGQVGYSILLFRAAE